MKKLLLIVDDWELLERYEERFMSTYEILCAPLGPEGIRIAQEEIPDAVLLNLTFENMTNEEGCAALEADSRTRLIPLAIVGEGGPGPYLWLKSPVTLASLEKLFSGQ